MQITANTTLGELQLELAKLGIDSLVWSVIGGINGVTVVGDEGRFVEHSRDLIDAVAAAIRKYADKLGTGLIFENRNKLSEQSTEQLLKMRQSIANAKKDPDQ